VAHRYRVGAELGRGGMGRVVEAYDLQLGRTVALKEVLPSGGDGTVRRFEREVQLTAKLEHPSIVPIYDAGLTDDGRPFYVMRRVSGQPLDELLLRARSLGERLVLVPALLAAIDAVAHAHRRGVIHRDLKPQNILVGELGETVVIDWGLAKAIGEAPAAEEAAVSGRGGRGSVPPVLAPDGALRTQLGSVFGTPGFMSPEQARGEELGTRGDVYALGATLYQLLAGQPPHHGTSVTEVIDRTARQAVRPLAEVASGAPPELVAIAEQALAFDARERYPDAGALAEDVRRFLAGQLVAAHRYTARQRLARFLRRHRAVLAVAVVALAALAVLGIVSVRRVVTERDAADAARGAALAGKREAEAARDALAERHDALVITQARALVDASPTEAAAVLKAIPAGSPRLPEARAVAQAAAMRGVAWALETAVELTSFAELAPGGRRLLQVTRDGTVRVWDLAQRRLVAARAYPPLSRAIWVGRDRVLVILARAPPELLAPDSRASEPLGLPPLALAVASVTGGAVAYAPAGGGVGVLDVASRQARLLDGATLARELAIAPDAAWVAIAGQTAGPGAQARAALRVVAAAHGRELARRDGAHLVLRRSPTGALAALSDTGEVVECRMAEPTAGCAVLPLGAPSGRVADIEYRGTELSAWVSLGVVLGWSGDRWIRRGEIDRRSSPLTPVAGDALAVAGAEGKVHVITALGRATLTVPSVVPRARLVARADAARVVVIGDGLLVCFELGPVLPRALPVDVGTQVAFVDDHTLLVSRGLHLEWRWIDLDTGHTVPFEHRMQGLPELYQIDPASGRVLIRERGPAHRLVLFRKGSAEARVMAEVRPRPGAAEAAPGLWGRLLQGDAIAFGEGDARVLVAIGAAPAREVARLDGDVDSGVALGYRALAVRSVTGELARIDLAGAAAGAPARIDRARGPGAAGGFLAADRSGRVLIVDGARVYVWDGAVTELLALPRPISRLDPHGSGALLHHADAEVYATELVPGAVPRRLLAPSRRGAAMSADGKLLVALDHAQQATIVELPAGARWTLPAWVSANDEIAVAPAGRRVVQGAGRLLAVWDLPEASPELGAWLGELTNAAVDEGGVLIWPWQRGAAAR
jgi:hypothetical protein